LVAAATIRPPHVPPPGSLRIAIRDCRQALEAVGSTVTIEVRAGYGWRLVTVTELARELLRRKRFIVGSDF
jgi:hypothetical protein